jgi:hypothetical protein
LFEEFLQFSLAAGITASPRMSRWTLIAANEDVLLELWHGNPRAEFERIPRTDRSGISGQPRF